jgi:SAM-dependent methyltransferase
MKNNTSWESSHQWYDKLVGEKGHYYHEHIVLPNLLKLLQLSPGQKLLDLACGQGILARHLPKKIEYLGIDSSRSLIQEAKKKSPHSFLVGDVTTPLVAPHNFTHATFILALQNIAEPQKALQNCSSHLIFGGKLALVLNHPCFRIPRQSSWDIDESKKLQYRRIERYLSPLKIPIQMYPGETWSFHHPLSDISRWLYEAGFNIELLEEWVSDKKSTGTHARMENRCREEFPLFLAILAKKIT